jgi:hypothetical protein
MHVWGYGVKTQISLEIDKRISSIINADKETHYFAYFTDEPNASRNPSTSNPWMIFKELDDAVKFKAQDHPKVERIRLTLSSVISNRIVQSHPELIDYVDELIQLVKNAAGADFRPYFCRINLGELPSGSYKTIHTSITHEYYTDGYSLPESLLEVVI